MLSLDRKRMAQNPLTPQRIDGPADDVNNTRRSYCYGNLVPLIPGVRRCDPVTYEN